MKRLALLFYRLKSSISTRTKQTNNNITATRRYGFVNIHVAIFESIWCYRYLISYKCNNLEFFGPLINRPSPLLTSWELSQLRMLSFVKKHGKSADYQNQSCAFSKQPQPRADAKPRSARWHCGCLSFFLTSRWLWPSACLHDVCRVFGDCLPSLMGWLSFWDPSQLVETNLKFDLEMEDLLGPP